MLVMVPAIGHPYHTALSVCIDVSSASSVCTSVELFRQNSKVHAAQTRAMHAACKRSICAILAQNRSQ